jgi:hypothetical protein
MMKTGLESLMSKEAVLRIGHTLRHSSNSNKTNRPGPSADCIRY